MRKPTYRNSLSRRDFLKMGGGLLGAAAGAGLLGKAFLQPDKVVQAARVVGKGDNAPLSSAEAAPLAQVDGKELHFAATDGWIYLDPNATVLPYHPDNMAPGEFTTYIFGFRDVTGLNNTQVFNQKMKAQLTAPLFWLEQETDNLMRVTNLGLQIRPDLIDAHTLHFHGFRNAIPIFDGEPHSSVGIPIARELTYFYRPHDPGTYMYHCHFEETEHVHMGMIGPCFVTPIQNYDGYGEDPTTVAQLGGNLDPTAPRGYVFNDADGSTAYDREFIMLVSEIWTESHWCDSHVQLPEWSDYNPEFYLLNGRVYPDTLKPNGGGRNNQGELIAPPGFPELQYQPVSSLVQCNEGDRVLFRMINLGFQEQAMRLAGIKMKVVGKDATQLRGRDGTDLTYLTSTVAIGPGESTDAIFTAPAFDPTKVTNDPVYGDYNTYLFYNRNFQRLSNGGHGGYGGAMTEIRVFSDSTVIPAQTAPNT
jgi:FtsP/CotA-like multicopper oxidase with cupredoxin domain